MIFLHHCHWEFLYGLGKEIPSLYVSSLQFTSFCGFGKQILLCISERLPNFSINVRRNFSELFQTFIYWPSTDEFLTMNHLSSLVTCNIQTECNIHCLWVGENGTFSILTCQKTASASIHLNFKEQFETAHKSFQADQVYHFWVVKWIIEFWGNAATCKGWPRAFAPHLN